MWPSSDLFFWPAPRGWEGGVVVVVVELFHDERFLVLQMASVATENVTKDKTSIRSLPPALGK